MDLKRFLGTSGHCPLGFLWSEFRQESVPPPGGGGITQTNRFQLPDFVKLKYRKRRTLAAGLSPHIGRARQRSRRLMVLSRSIGLEHLLPRRIFLVCGVCGHEQVFHRRHREALAKRLGKLPDAVTEKDVLRSAARFRCREGHRSVAVRTEERRPPAVRYVASGTAIQKHVFHKDTCGWVGHIHKAHIIQFPSRDHAVESGFEPCRYCRP